MTLAILICTLPERSHILKRLTNVLDPQIERYKDQVYYSVHDAGRHLSTGSKRNQLVEQTNSDYFCFIDDDDMVSSFYIDSIMKALESNPDVVTFCGWMTTNGVHRRDWTIKLGSQYAERNGHYYRFPNHLTVMKRKLVEHVKFPDLWKMEDYKWALQIHEKRLLKTEVHIPLQLYHYDFDDTKPPYAEPTRVR